LASMARGVSNVVGDELSRRQGWDARQLKDFIESKKRSKRWQQDVWG